MVERENLFISELCAGPVKYFDKDGKDPDVLHIYGKVKVKMLRTNFKVILSRSGNLEKAFRIQILKFLECWTCLL